MNKFFIGFTIGLMSLMHCLAQGQGGGVWLEDGAEGLGLVIYNNQAKEGFGVAGGKATLLNCTIYGNKAYLDDIHFPIPGDIYCADGEIVNPETYKNRAVKNAIGVVYWVNTDPNENAYPRGAVVALDGQEQTKWGNNSLWICKGEPLDPWGDPDDEFADYEAITGLFLLDTACYGNTAQMVKRDPAIFEAGHYCWNYKAYYQLNQAHQATQNRRWCMPTLSFLRRMILTLPEVKTTLEFLKTTNAEINIQDFKDQNEKLADYWSSDDGNAQVDKGFAFNVSFCTGQMDLRERGNKSSKRWVRPIFLY